MPQPHPRPHPSPWTRRRFLGAAGAGLAAVTLAGCNLDRASSPDEAASADESDFAGQLVDPPYEMPDLTFTDMNGERFPLRAKTEGKLSILFFGYTSCPDVCPIYLNTMAKAIEAIGTGPGSNPQVLFVGVDIARDTPARLREYLGNFNPTFLGLTASEKTIAEANRELDMPPITIEAPDANGDYLVQHGATVFPFTADGLAHRIYPSDVRQQDWVHDLPRLAQGQWQ